MLGLTRQKVDLLRGLRKVLRDKVVRALEEVVGRHATEHATRIAELRREVADLHGRLSRDLHEQAGRIAETVKEAVRRGRRDMSQAGELEATLQSVAWIRNHMPVAQGLPETWRPGFPAGTFATEDLPDVPGPNWSWARSTTPCPSSSASAGPVDFVHVDCDLYRSTKTVLDHIGTHLHPGSIVVFDEYFNYPGWQEHEHRAWSEYVEQTGLRFEYVGHTVDHEQVIVRVLPR